MSTSMTHRSGTLLSASPPQIRPRLIEGRSKSSELCLANGSDSILRKTSCAFNTALSPRQRPLHVVGAPADQALAVDSRRELLPKARNDVEMAVQHDGRRAGADLRERDRQPAHRLLACLDAARLEPSLDEAGSLVDGVGL